MHEETVTGFGELSWIKPLSDSDSGDSLFLTQHDAQPVRTVKRQRPEENALSQFAAGEFHCEDEESGSPNRQWDTTSHPRRTCKFSQLRQRRLGHKRLSRRKSLTCELGALGGFFKCVMKMKSEAVKVTKRPRKRQPPDTRSCISPPSDLGEGEDSEDGDIKIVGLKDFIPRYKMARKGYNPWLDRNDTLDTVAEEHNDPSETTPDISDSCSESSGSDREAGSWENECSESETESLPVLRHSSERLSSCVPDAVARCFRQDEIQQKASRASNPEMSTGVELRTMRGDTAKKLHLAGKRPPRVTMIQAEVSEQDGTTEYLRLRNSPVTQLLDQGERGNSQGKGPGEEEGSLWDAILQRDRDGDNKGQRGGIIVNSAGGKTKILPVPLRKSGTWEDEETNVDLQGSVPEERVTVPNSVHVETEDGKKDTVEDTMQSVTEAQPAGLLREEKPSKRTEMPDEETVGLPPDGVPAEDETAGGAVEPDPHTQPPRDCQHQTPDEEYSSIVGEGEHLLLNFSIPEAIGDSASGDVTCEKGMRKKKKKKRKREMDDQQNVEEHGNEPPPETFSDSLHMTQDGERNSGVGLGECCILSSGVTEPVGDSASGDVTCEEGMRKKKKKKRKKEKDDQENVEEHVNEPPPETLSTSLHLTQDMETNFAADESSVLVSGVSEPVGDSTSSDVIGEEGISKWKKKKTKKEKGACENVEEHGNKVPSQTVSDSLHLTQDKEKNSGVGIDECSVLVSGVSEPVGDSASGDVIGEEGRRKKKKKRKKEDCGNVEERVSEPTSETLSDSIHLMHDKEKMSGAGEGEHSLLISNIPEPVGDSASGDVICEEGMRKKKKKRERCAHVEEEVGKPQSHKLEDSVHQTKYKEKGSTLDIGGHSLLRSCIPEAVGDSASGDVTCEEVISKRKKKKRKREKDDSENVEEHGNEPPPETFSDSLHMRQDGERNSGVGQGECCILSSGVTEPVGDSASGDVTCEEGMRKKKKKKRKNEKDAQENVEEHGNEPPPETVSNSLHLTQDGERNSGVGLGECCILSSGVTEPVGDSTSGDVIGEEGMRKKKKKKRKNEKDAQENVEEHGNEPPPETVSNSLHLTQDGERNSGVGLGECCILSSGVTEPVGDSTSGDVIGEEGISKRKKKKRKKDKDDQENVEELSEPVGDSASGDVICEEGMRKKKKKKRKKEIDDNGNVVEHVNEPPPETFSDCPHLTRDLEKSSGAGVGGEHSVFNCNVPEPVGDSASGDVICEEGIRKKKRKEDKNGNVEEHVSELLSCTRKDSQPEAQDQDRRAVEGEYSHSNFSSQEPVNDSASGDVCEEGTRKKKKKKKRDT